MGEPIEWIAEPDEVMADLGSWIVREPNSFIVCCVYDNGGRRQHVAEKHARLIASAPALAAEVERLREALGRMVRAVKGEEEGPENDETWGELIAHCEAALARQEAGRG